MSTIDDAFRKMLDGIKQADEARDEIMRGLEEAWKARTDLGEQLADLRDTVSQLQQLVMDQGQQLVAQSAEIRRLSDRLEGGR